MQRHIKLLERLLKYLVAAVLMGVPLYQKFPFIRITGTFVAIRFEDFLILAVALVSILLLLPRYRDFIKDDINKAIFFFLLVGLVSVLSGIFLTQTASLRIGFLHWFRRIEYFVPMFAGILALRLDRKNLEFYLKLLIIVILAVFLYGFGQKYFAWPIIVTQNLEYSKGIALRYIPGSHINSTFAGHYDLATFLVLVMPIIILLLVLLKGFRTKVILSLTLVASLWLLVNAASRISILSYLAGASLSLILIRKYRVVPFIVAGSFVIMVLFSLSTNLGSRYTKLIDVAKEKIKILKIDFSVPKEVFAQGEVSNPFKRLQATPTPTPPPVLEDRSTSIRLNVEWPRAIRALVKNPFLGTGYSSITLATDNDFLRALGEVGLLGFFAFLLILVRVGKLFLEMLPLNKNYKGVELAFVAGVIGAIPGILLNAAFIDVFEASKFAIIFWLIIGMVVQLAKGKIYE